MKAYVFALAIVLLAGSAIAGRSLNQFTSGTCAAFGSLSVVVKHGSCSGLAKASCETFASAQTVIDETFAAGVTFDFCDVLTVEAKAEAIARALAEVYVESLAKVECDGLGFGCGFALAKGDSYATAYARSFAKAVAAALSDNLSAVCVADLEALAAGIADVAADSNAKACVNGSGSAEAFRSEFIFALTVLITDAIATVTAEICIDGEEKAECTADVFGFSVPVTVVAEETVDETVTTPGNPGNPFDGDNTADTDGGSSGVSTKIKPCAGSDKKCCTTLCDPKKDGVELGADLTGEHNLVLNIAGTRSPVCWCH